MSRASRLRHKVGKQLEEQRRFDAGTEALIRRAEALAGGRSRVTPGHFVVAEHEARGLMSTVMPSIHAECFVCGAALPRRQLVNVYNGSQYIHAGRCSDVVRALLERQRLSQGPSTDSA